MNNVVLSGTLGKKVKIIQLENGVNLFSNTICTSDSEDKFTWINVVAYAELADYIVSNFEDEQYVIIQGRLKTRSWYDKDYSEKRYITEVLIYRIEGVD